MMTSLIIPTGTLSQLTVMNCSMTAGALIEANPGAAGYADNVPG
jgi:hypothetical protein